MNKDVRFFKFLRRIYQSNEYRLCGISKLLYNFVDCIGHNLLTISPHERVTRWRSWFRHCATSRKVAASIPDGVIKIFH